MDASHTSIRMVTSVIGYVGTDVAATTSSGAASLRTDINYVNDNLLERLDL